jgi:hypothetical protein
VDDFDLRQWVQPAGDGCSVREERGVRTED